MPRSHFKLMSKNPNPRGGCLCSPNAKLGDCVGPYIVFPNSEMMDVRSPNPVLSCACAHVAVGKAAKRSDAPGSLKPVASEQLPVPPVLPSTPDKRQTKVNEMLELLDELRELDAR